MSEQADLCGQVMVVTGASSGIGAEAARLFQRRGATVVLIGRSPQRTSAIAAELGSPAYVCDFADLGQVRRGNRPTCQGCPNGLVGVAGRRGQAVRLPPPEQSLVILGLTLHAQGNPQR